MANRRKRKGKRLTTTTHRRTFTPSRAAGESQHSLKPLIIKLAWLSIGLALILASYLVKEGKIGELVALLHLSLPSLALLTRQYIETPWPMILCPLMIFCPLLVVAHVAA